MQFHGGDIVYLYNTRARTYIYAKTLDFFDITNLRKVLAHPTYGPDITLAQRFQVLVVSVPPLTLRGHGPRDRISNQTDSTGPVAAGTAFRLLKSDNDNDGKNAQFLTIMQHGSDETFASTNRYNLTVLHRPLVAYTTAADNSTGNLFIANSANAFSELSILTFYNRVALHDPRIEGNLLLEPSVNEPVDEYHDPQWSIMLAGVAVLRGCAMKSMAGMTIASDATDSTGARVFRTADECNAYRFAYPEDFVVGWQCVNTGGALGVNRCVSVTQYTTNDRQPLFSSAGTCLAGSVGAMTPETTETVGTTASEITRATAPKTVGSVGATSKSKGMASGVGTFGIIVVCSVIVLLVICVFFWKKKSQILQTNGA